VGEQAQPCQWAQSQEPWSDENLQGFACPSCAGELVGDAKTASTRCPYCGNPTVISSRLSGMFKPDFVIPFRLDKQAAKQGFADKLKGKRLLPKNFANQSVLDEMVGSYVPFWLFDAQAKANGAWRATRTKSWSDRHFRYTRTDHFQLRRAGEAVFTQVPVNACTKMQGEYMDAIEPFDYSGMQPFHMTYLSGYLADKYDITAEQSRPRVEQRAAQSMDGALTQSSGGGNYNSIQKEGGQAWLAQAKASYALMPVWNLNARYGNKTYRFAMNGQTGKFVGELPIDKGRQAAWFCGLFFGTAAVAALLAFFMQSGFVFLLGLIVAALFAFGVVGAFKKQMNTARPQKTACNYMQGFRITQQKDTFLYSNTQRVRLQQNPAVAARPGMAARPGGGMGARPGGGSFKGGKKF